MIERLVDITNGALLGICALWALRFLTHTYDDTPKRLRQWTGVLTLVCGIITSLWIVCSFIDPALVEDMGASVMGGLLAIPFTVFVMMELTRLCNVTFRHVVTHLAIPVLLFAVYMVQMVWDMHTTDSALVQGRSITLVLFCIWMGGYILYYTYRFTVAVRRYEEIVGDIYADVEGRNINWLGRVMSIVFGVSVAFALFILNMDEHWTWVAYNVVFGIFLMELCLNISLMRNNDAIETAEIAEMAEMAEEAQTVTEPAEVKSAEEGTAVAEERNEIISDLKARMMENDLYLQPNLTRETAARALGTNHIELTRRIKSETGMTFSQFVTSIRMEHAAELLTSSTMTVDEILYACGFRSNSTFYRQFTERYHCSPIEYRQNNSK